MTVYVFRDASEFEIHLVPGENNSLDEREAMVVMYPNGWKMFLWSNGTFQIQNGNSLMSPGVELTEHDIRDTHINATPVVKSPAPAAPERKKARASK